MNMPGFNLNDMSPDEKLRLLEELWDSLSANPDAVPLTAAQRQELDRRLDELERDGTSGIPWDDVLREIESRPR